jgi:hypothetical protein
VRSVPKKYRIQDTGYRRISRHTQHPMLCSEGKWMVVVCMCGGVINITVQQIAWRQHAFQRELIVCEA